MATPIAELFVSVGADVSGAILGLQSLAGELTAVNGAFAAAVPAAEAMVAAGLGIAAGLGAAAVAAADFQEKIVQVRNNTTLTDEGMAAMQQTILKLGAEAPVDLNNLAEGFMHVSNFGFDAAESTTILEAAMRSAVSTGGNTAKTAEVLAAVLHEFGLSGSEAATVMDELHTAAAEGNLTLEQFSSSFGQVAAFAASLGVPLDEAAAAMSAMTRHGFDAATAATQVKDSLVHIINPSQEAKKQLTDLSQRSGVDLVHAFTATGLHALGLEGVLNLTSDAMNKLGLTQDEQTAQWLRLIPNIRGGVAGFVLAGRGADDFASILKDMHEQLGVTDEAFARIKETTGFQFGLLGNQFKELAITLGSILLPSINGIVKSFSALILQFTQLPQNVQQGIVKVLAIASGLLTFGGAMILLAPLFGAVLSGIGSLVTAFVSLSPAILLGLGVFAVLRQAWDRDIGGIREVVDRFSNIGDIIQAALSGNVSAAFDGFIEDFKSISPEIRSFIDDVQSRFNGLQSFLTPILGNIGLVLDKAFSGNFAGAFDTLQAIITAISPQVGGLIQNFRDFANQVAPVIQQGFVAAQGFINDFLNTAREVVAFLSTTFGPLLETVGNFVAQQIGPAFQLTATAVGLLKDTLGGVVENGLRPLKVLVDAFAANPDALPSFFSALGDALLALGGKIQTVAPVLVSLAGLFGAINNLIGTIAQVGFQALIALFENALIPAFQKFAPILIALSAPLAAVFAPLLATFKVITDNADTIVNFVNNMATAINNLAAALGKLPTTLPSWLQINGGVPDILGGGQVDLGALGNQAGGALSGAAGAITGSQIVINNNGVTITSGADLDDFSQSIANAIRNAATRVSPPVSNGGNPAIEGTFT